MKKSEEQTFPIELLKNYFTDGKKHLRGDTIELKTEDALGLVIIGVGQINSEEYLNRIINGSN